MNQQEICLGLKYVKQPEARVYHLNLFDISSAFISIMAGVLQVIESTEQIIVCMIYIEMRYLLHKTGLRCS